MGIASMIQREEEDGKKILPCDTLHGLEPFFDKKASRKRKDKAKRAVFDEQDRQRQLSNNNNNEKGEKNSTNPTTYDAVAIAKAYRRTGILNASTDEARSVGERLHNYLYCSNNRTTTTR